MLNFRQIGALLIFAALCAVVSVSSPGRDLGRDLPAAQWAVSEGWADERVCSNCHTDQSELFWQTGHARTLQRATQASSLELLSKFAEVADSKDARLRMNLEGPLVQAVQSAEVPPRQLKLDWCFGSGEHARTWVGTLPDSWGDRDLVEFRWTWFHELDDFGITPGQPQQTNIGYFAALGLLYDTPKARRCFSCHATVLPQEQGVTRFEDLHAGVTCQRCHGPRQKHVETEGEIKEGFWKTASQLESVHRCGECHRIAEDQKPSDIQPDNTDIVRFQPVGLSQSPCFLGSKEMTCLTCHDPHRPLGVQDSKGIWQCVQCHSETSEKHSGCAAGHLEDCLTCHMPKVKTMQGLKFTDHWIRIRKNPDSSSP